MVFIRNTLIRIRNKLSKVVNVISNKNNEILKDLTVTAQRSTKFRCTCTCSIRTGTLRSHMGSCCQQHRQLQRGEKISSNLMKNLFIHYSRGNAKCFNDINTIILLSYQPVRRTSLR